MAIYVKNYRSGRIRQIETYRGKTETERVLNLYLAKGYDEIPATIAWYQCLSSIQQDIVTHEAKARDSENWPELLDVWRIDLRGIAEWLYEQGYEVSPHLAGL